MPPGSADQLQSIPMSPNLSQSFGRAKDFAREQNIARCSWSTCCWR